MDKLRLTADLHRMRRILEKGDTTKLEVEQRRQGIARDEDHSERWKRERLEALNREAASIYRACGTAAAEVAQDIQKAVDDAANAFDFMDERFQSALRTLQVMGRGTPYNVQSQIVDAFTGNPDALRSLRPMYEQNGFSTSEIDRRLKPFSEFGTGIMDDENFTRFVAYATTEGFTSEDGKEILPTWEPLAVKNVLATYESAFQVDASENPYLRSIKDYIATAKQPLNRARAERFLKTYGDRLSADDPNACERAAIALENDFEPAGI